MNVTCYLQLHTGFMPWLQLKLEADKNQVHQVIHALDDCGALSVTVEDKDEYAQFQEQTGTTVFWTHNHVIGLFSADTDVSVVMQQIEQRCGSTPAHSTAILADRNWELAWRTEYGPIEIDEKLCICPSWSTPPRTAINSVFIDPGLAFGSGTHATTRLCLQWLAQNDMADADVIDYGCGSGILAIAALKLGARRAWGVDNDTRALHVSRENAAQNAVAGQYQELAPESLPPQLQADIVLANILAQPLIELAPTLVALVRNGGNLILSGLLESQASDVSTRYAQLLAIDAQVQQEDAQGYRWVMLVMSKHDAAS